jgi:hypothetical protein
MAERIEVWQDETEVDGLMYVWCVSVVDPDEGREVQCLYDGPALGAVRFAIGEAAKRRLPWGIRDRFGHYIDFTGLDLSMASLVLVVIEIASRQRGGFVEKHLREIEREEEEV